MLHLVRAIGYGMDIRSIACQAEDGREMANSSALAVREGRFWSFY